MTIAEELKEDGINTVLSNNETWKLAYKEYVKALPPGEYTGEDIRFLVEPIIGPPSHPNAWGAVFNGVLRSKPVVFIGTGVYKKMEDAKSHARATQIYRKLS